MKRIKDLHYLPMSGINPPPPGHWTLGSGCCAKMEC